MSTDVYLTLGALAVELGVPIVTAVVMMRVPRIRKSATVVLGALTPLLLMYGFATFSYLLDPEEQEKVFSFHAMWVMSFFAYIVLFAAGVLVSLVPKPTNLYGRFLVGFGLAPLTYALIVSTRL